MTTLKILGVCLVVALLALGGWHLYTTYLAAMPPGVWRVFGATWTAWASWHTYRVLVR